MNRLSFGIKSVSRIIDQILREVPKTGPTSMTLHMDLRRKNVIVCFNQLWKFDLHLNRRKCLLFQEHIKFLTHLTSLISNSNLKIIRESHSLIEMARPTSNDEMRRFLGINIFTYWFIPNTSTIIASLRQLLKKNTVNVVHCLMWNISFHPAKTKSWKWLSSYAF